MKHPGIDDLASGRALEYLGSRRADGGRNVLPALMLAVSFMLALAAGVAPAPAEARDLVMLRTELRRGELSSCDATACRLDSDTIPRQSIAIIGLGDPPLPMPTIRNPAQDELHLQDGSVRPGPLVSLDARRVITPERTFERREVRWIYLAYVPPSGDVARKPSSVQGGSEDDGTCRFWVGMLRQRVLMRNTTTYNQLHTTVRTVYAARFKETSGPIAPGTTTVGTRRIQAIRVPLKLDGGVVREHMRSTLSGPGGNGAMGSGAGEFGGQVGGGSLVTEVPSGRIYYEVGLRASEFKYRLTVRWNRGTTTQSDQGVQGIDVGEGPDPERPRTMDRGSLVMKGEYAVTGPEYGHIVARTVAWDLTAVTARCSAPPPVPALPDEGDSPDSDSPDGEQP